MESCLWHWVLWSVGLCHDSGFTQGFVYLSLPLKFIVFISGSLVINLGQCGLGDCPYSLYVGSHRFLSVAFPRMEIHAGRGWFCWLLPSLVLLLHTLLKLLCCHWSVYVWLVFPRRGWPPGMGSSLAFPLCWGDSRHSIAMVCMR